HNGRRRRVRLEYIGDHLRRLLVMKARGLGAVGNIGSEDSTAKTAKQNREAAQKGRGSNHGSSDWMKCERKRIAPSVKIRSLPSGRYRQASSLRNPGCAVQNQQVAGTENTVRSQLRFGTPRLCKGVIPRPHPAYPLHFSEYMNYSHLRAVLLV